MEEQLKREMTKSRVVLKAALATTVRPTKAE